MCCGASVKSEHHQAAGLSVPLFLFQIIDITVIEEPSHPLLLSPSSISRQKKKHLFEAMFFLKG